MSEAQVCARLALEHVSHCRTYLSPCRIQGIVVSPFFPCLSRALFVRSMNDDEEDLLLLLLHRRRQEEEERQSNLERLRRRLRSAGISRASLHHPMHSAFMKLYNSGKDASLIALCGFDFSSFHKLLDLFAPYFDNWTPYPQSAKNRRPMRRLTAKGKRRGRRLIDAKICLGLVLAWTRTRGSTMLLQLVFGLTANPLSVWLRVG